MKGSSNKTKDKGKEHMLKIILVGIKVNLIMILNKAKEFRFFIKKLHLKGIF